MKTKQIALITLIAAGSATCIFADSPAPRNGTGRPEVRAKLLERFDADGDGTLSKEERLAARKAHQKITAQRQARRHKMIERFDTDGDGTLCEAERVAAREARQQVAAQRQTRRQEMLIKFDADGDGTLSVEERIALRDYMQTQRNAE